MSNLSLLANGMQQFADANGVPYLAGTVNMWIPNTETTKPSWQDMDHLALNTDPIVLDAAGRCVIWGEGIYRQVLKDLNGNTVWDKLTLYHDFSDLVVSSLYDLPVFIEDFPGISEEFPIFAIPRALRLPAGLTGTQAKIKTNPTATLTMTIWKNLVQIGSIAFATTGVPTITFASQIDFAAGDTLSLIAPAIQDLTGEDISITFVLTVL
jgi:hypothetical protein